MAINKRKQSGSVVSRSSGRDTVVSGARLVRGRIIGEVLSGGRNISGVSIKQRQAPRPTRGSARHSLHPAPKLSREFDYEPDDYSDFGFEEEDEVAEASYDAWGALRTSPASSGSGSVALPRPEPRSPAGRGSVNSAAVGQAVGIAFMGLAPFFVMGLLYAIFANELAEDIPYVKLAIIPLLLALFCGVKLGRFARQKAAAGTPITVALGGVALGSLLIGAALYGAFVGIGLYPLTVISHYFDLPHEIYEYLQIADMGLNWFFGTLRVASFPAVPLIGALWGLMRG